MKLTIAKYETVVPAQGPVVVRLFVIWREPYDAFSWPPLKEWRPDRVRSRWREPRWKER